MEKTKAAAIVKRIVTSLILAPVVLWAVYCGSPVINLLALTGGALLAWEWAAMVPNGKASVYGIIYTVSVATAVLTSSAPVIATVILAATLLVWLKAGEEKHRRLLTLGVPYISLGIGSLVWLFNLVGAYTTIWFVLVIWSVDIGGYLVGSNVKGGAENQPEQNLVGAARRNGVCGCRQRRLFALAGQSAGLFGFCPVRYDYCRG